MTEAANHWKLGMFVVVGMTLLMITVVYLGSRSLYDESVPYVSYFDEAVTGLEVGSPVRFRGVTVGKVSDIDVAPDQRHVQISYALGIAVLGRLGLSTDAGESTKLLMPPDLRAQISSTGVTGVKYVLIDFFGAKDHPAPVLGFKVPTRNIPTTPSTMKNIEESVVRAIDTFPQLAQDMQQITNQVNALLLDVSSQHLSERAAATLDGVDQTLALIRGNIRDVDAKQLSSDARNTLTALTATMERAQLVMERLDGERGVFASVQRASDSMGDVAGEARGYGGELSAMLRDLREAASAFERLAEALELDPDMLLKGRAEGRP